MYNSPRVTLPFSVHSQCEGTTDKAHIVEYRAYSKLVWCERCEAELDWNACLPHLLHDALKSMEDLQYKDDL